MSDPARPPRSPFTDARHAAPNPAGRADDRSGDGPAAPANVVLVAGFARFTDLRRRLGYQAAGALLAELTGRATALLPGAALGRVGRTSFECAFRCEDPGAAEPLLARLHAALSRPLAIDGLPITPYPTIGAAPLGPDGLTDQALDLAASALEEAERAHQPVRLAAHGSWDGTGADGAGDDGAGGGTTGADLSLLRDVPAAQASGAMRLLYQPKLRTRTNRIDSAEALLRWTHPVRGAVPVEPFIRLAEETGAIWGLTEWVLRTAVADQRALAQAGHDITLWVNISGQLLPEAEFAQTALALVAPANGRIGFEITETAVIGDPARAMANVAAFSAAGVRIAIDDYGSGLSSLGYLKQLPAQELKIDRLFIAELINSHRDPLLVRSSIDLAHALEMEVTAEGVDNPMTLALLRVMGCDLAQGFLIAPAVPRDALVALLEDADRLAALAAPVPALGRPARQSGGQKG